MTFGITSTQILKTSPKDELLLTKMIHKSTWLPITEPPPGSLLSFGKSRSGNLCHSPSPLPPLNVPCGKGRKLATNISFTGIHQAPSYQFWQEPEREPLSFPIPLATTECAVWQGPEAGAKYFIHRHPPGSLLPILARARAGTFVIPHPPCHH